MRLLYASLIALALASCASAAGARGATDGEASSITFWTDEPGPSIWSIRPDGSGLHRILRTSQNAKRPRLSPDRRWIAFDGAPPGKPVLTDFDIQLVRRDGSGRRTLVRSAQPDIDPQWAPDGRRISFTRTPGYDWTRASTWTVRPDGADLRQLARGQFGRWSPDGSQLVLDAPTTGSPGDIFVVDVASGRRRLILESPQLDQPADWSPDGQRILFTRFSSTSSRGSVYAVNVDGTGLRLLAAGIAGSFSPDGTEIVYTRSFPGRLLMMRADGSHKRALPGVIGAEPDWR
jgi:Tol biopolymer transport system component